jgi:opacity protein-like surface antigen
MKLQEEDMKKVLLAMALALVSTSSASAFEVVTGQNTINSVVVDGTAYAIPLNRICGLSSMKAGHARYDIGRDGKYVTIGGVITRITCVGGGGGGGAGSNQAYKDEWKDSPLVDDGGNVTMNPGETVTEHPSTDPADSGFEGDGPPSIDG